jgi:hypothetical protein
MSKIASTRKWGCRRAVSFGLAGVLAGLFAYTQVTTRRAARGATHRLNDVEARADRLADAAEWTDGALSLRVERLGPMLASWETIGGCGAGGTGGTGVGVKWIGRNTTGGLFHSQNLVNYLNFTGGYNLIAIAQIDRDIDTAQKWNAGVVVPFLYKHYDSLFPPNPRVAPVSFSNSGVGDVSVYVARRLGPINATSITGALGIPTGTHDASYKGTLLHQDQQLGLGNFTGALIIDHTIDESWGLIVLGALGAYRGGTNDLGSYRAPTASVYSYAGYFLGPFVPSLGLSFTGFSGKDQDQGVDQDLPLYLAAGNASIEWSTDWIAVLLGASVPFGIDAGFAPQPWLVALGVSVSPF